MRRDEDSQRSGGTRDSFHSSSRVVRGGSVQPPRITYQSSRESTRERPPGKGSAVRSWAAGRRNLGWPSARSLAPFPMITQGVLDTAARIIEAATHVPRSERNAFRNARVAAVQGDRIMLQVDEHLHYTILPSGLVWRLERRDSRLTGALFREGRLVSQGQPKADRAPFGEKR